MGRCLHWVMVIPHSAKNAYVLTIDSRDISLYNRFMRFFTRRIQELYVDIKKRFFQYLIGVITLVVGLYVSDLAGAFVEKFTYQCPLNDTIHNMLPLVNANILASLFPVIFGVIAFSYVILFEKEELPYILFLVGLFNFVRAFFLILTQLPPPYPRIDDYPYFKFPGWYFGTRDLFPSGHTGFPFLLFLSIRESRFFKWLSLFFTFTIALGVLLMRVHYSLDVFGAIFIVYAMYAFSERYIHRFFKTHKDQ